MLEKRVALVDGRECPRYIEKQADGLAAPTSRDPAVSEAGNWQAFDSSRSPPHGWCGELLHAGGGGRFSVFYQKSAMCLD